MSGLFLRTLRGEANRVPPVWLMRQAGRYLGEYRDVRKTAPDFIQFCLDAEKASRVTLQPIERFGFDAAIVFSDILLVPWALDRNVRFVEGIGPKLDPLVDGERVDERAPTRIGERLAGVGRTVSSCRAKLSEDRALIGFAGAPWTIITYMVEGGSSRDFAATRHMLWADRKGFDALLDVIVQCTVEFLDMQASSGADALMLFDSWAGAVPAHLRRDIVVRPARRIVSALRKRGHSQPVIGFPKGIGEGLVEYCDDADVDAVGLDHGVDVRWAARALPAGLPLQGNLDPAALIAGGGAMSEAVDAVLEAFAGRPHIFNLGHGIAPNTPVDHVQRLLDQVRGRG